MMTILHTESSKGWGGQENRIFNEARWLYKNGVRVILLCQPNSLLAKKAREVGIKVIYNKMRKNYNILAIYKILSIISSEKVDIIHTHSGRDSFLAGIAGRLSPRKPIIIRTRHLALPPTSIITYKILPHKVITVSEYVREILIKKNVPPEKIITIHTGIDLERFNPAEITTDIRTEFKIKQNVPLIGTVAIFRYKKGYNVLLDAIPVVLRDVPDAVFLLVGDGPQKKNIINKINDLSLSKNVIMTGLREDVDAILKSIDLFVLPTLQEALGTSFLEAMAMGKPVIGTNIDGVKEVIRDGMNGLMVEPNDHLSLANAIVKILKNKALCTRFGIEGRRLVVENFSVEKMCERTYKLYRSMLKQRNS